MMSANDVSRWNNIKMTTDIVGRQHAPTITGIRMWCGPCIPASVTDCHSKPQQELREYQWVLGVLCLLLRM